MNTSTALATLTTVFALFLMNAGCSSSATSALLSSTNPATILTGRVSAGPVANSTVTVYQLNSDGSTGSVLGIATTDSTGKYSVNVAGSNGPVILIATAGSYDEESGGSTISLGQAQLRTVIASVTANQTVGITPISEIASQHAIAAVRNNIILTPAVIIASSNAKVAAAFGLADVTLPPADPTKPASEASNPQAAKYAVALGALSHLAKNASSTLGTSINSLDLMQSLAVSFTYSGTFGNTVGGNSVPVPNSSGSALSLSQALAASGSAAGFQTAMQNAMTDYLQSPLATNNGFDDATLVPPPVFNTTPPAPVDAPSIALPIPPLELPKDRPITAGPPAVPTPPPADLPWVGAKYAASNYIRNVSADNVSVTDSNGNIYVTYVSRRSSANTDLGHLGLTKFNRSGYVVWERKFEIANETVVPQTISLDADGNVYIAYSTWSSNTGSKYALLVYSPSGETEGPKTLQLDGEDFNARQIAFQTNGNMILVGTKASSTPGLTPSYLVSISSSGSIIWSHQITGDLRGRSLIIDSLNNIYVGLSKYNSTGELQWTADPAETDAVASVNSVAFDSAGNMYAAGSLSSSTYDQAFGSRGYLIKISSSGAKIWSRQIGNAGKATQVKGLVIDSGGAIYAAGVTNSDIGNSASLGEYDAFLMKYSSSGDIGWIRRLGKENVQTWGAGLTMDTNQSLYLAGETNFNFDTGAALPKTAIYVVRFSRAGARE